MCTAEYLRVYSVGNVVGGERTTIKKVSAPCPILQAATFQADGAPGLICLALNSGVPHLLVRPGPALPCPARLLLAVCGHRSGCTPPPAGTRHQPRKQLPALWLHASGSHLGTAEG
jgi:hypothetical protein